MFIFIYIHTHHIYVCIYYTEYRNHILAMFFLFLQQCIWPKHPSLSCEKISAVCRRRRNVPDGCCLHNIHLNMCTVCFGKIKINKKDSVLCIAKKVNISAPQTAVERLWFIHLLKAFVKIKGFVLISFCWLWKKFLIKYYLIVHQIWT